MKNQQNGPNEVFDEYIKDANGWPPPEDINISREMCSLDWGPTVCPKPEERAGLLLNFQPPRVILLSRFEVPVGAVLNSESINISTSPIRRWPQSAPCAFWPTWCFCFSSFDEGRTMRSSTGGAMRDNTIGDSIWIQGDANNHCLYLQIDLIDHVNHQKLMFGTLWGTYSSTAVFGFIRLWQVYVKKLTFVFGCLQLYEMFILQMYEGSGRIISMTLHCVVICQIICGVLG